jgi:energy-converting hydrogenase Eha subunit E
MSRRDVLRAQGAYFLMTGLWPLVHMASFEAVTGPKVDDWLVRMVGLLAAVIGGTLYLAAQRGTRALEVMVLAVSSALAFAAIDTWYAMKGRISPIYLADAALEIAIVLLLVNAADDPPA